MITCNLMGGLGNQLFQIFTVISYAIKRNHEFKFLNCEKLGLGETTVRNTYWKSFFSKLSSCLFDENPNFHIVYREEEATYKNIPGHLFQPNTNIMLVGYFQSYKYFQQNFNLICLILDIYEKRQEVLKECVENKILNIGKLKTTISIHFRLGDYKNIQQYHPIMSYEYYKKSLDYILNYIDYNPNVLYFCEDQDIDHVNETIKKLNVEYPSIQFSRAPNILNDWQQLLLMSACRNNIIANSSFSWWSAYINSYADKLVCYPSTWFGPACDKDTTDLFLPNWIKI